MNSRFLCRDLFPQLGIRSFELLRRFGLRSCPGPFRQMPCQHLRGRLLRPGSDGRIHGASSCGGRSVGHPSGCCPVVLDGIVVRGPLIDGSSRLWLAVCIRGELRSVAIIENFSCYVAVVGVVPASPSIVAVCFHVLCPGVSLAV